MKKILVILVGGTICTSEKNGVLSVDSKKGYALLENFKKTSSYASECEFTTSENLCILSENMTVEDYNTLLSVYRKHTSENKFDGVIFAHGTDTLAYSASLFAQILSGCSTPVFFVSAQKRLDAPDSNGFENFRCAAELICQNITPNVYVVYKNISDNKMYLHLGSRITQCKNYSNDFKSDGMCDISNGNFKNCFAGIFEKAKPVPFNFDNLVLKNCVLQILPYVGLRYDIFDLKNFKAVLHGSYHSSTACTKGEKTSLLYFAERCKNEGVLLFMSPVKDKGEIYESTANMKDAPINFLYGTTFETAYAKLLIACSLFNKNEEILNFMQKNHNFEKLD